MSKRLRRLMSKRQRTVQSLEPVSPQRLMGWQPAHQKLRVQQLKVIQLARVSSLL
jgi:hypothetical protein